ncbi:MAG: Poly-gamma-glutamate synthase subunit PgsC/CapC [candidate division TA06 bacterium 34_109]|jgi:poly-gamma-glutamate biosynthesis protein PgsC/CapC|uniref:Poly-gamma-glutamate synthase subunit PgsC/CapC n=1 Tax=candidate division TA06 bacterium 34_109 TaxID=1635277 RepID=A0A101I0D7_UNCT6|nr:MAG: Poly-gamma-glutamate synthase subunit PgsC/CapC [candidate division TA06 bacterium 34_109]
MIYQAIGIGIAIGFLFYELVGISPGGIVVPGYIALFINQPFRIIITVSIAILTYYIVLFLSNYLILYGKRRFLSMVLISFVMKWLVESFLFQLPVTSIELQSIGYIIPGLLANEMQRQGILITLLATAIVAILVRLTLYLFFF